MKAPPNNLVDVFGDVDQQIINRWWAGISEEDRADVVRLCDQRLDDCFFGVVANERDHLVPRPPFFSQAFNCNKYSGLRKTWMSPFIFRVKKNVDATFYFLN